MDESLNCSDGKLIFESLDESLTSSDGELFLKSLDESLTSSHRGTGSKICRGSPFNSKSDGNLSPTEIPSIREFQRALESFREPQTASETPQKPLREP